MAELAYTIDEVCNLSKLGRTTIYAAIRDGDLKARKFRRRTIILHEDLSRFLENLPEVAHELPIQT
jgi:excisionase family DNA binding protein